MNFYWTIPLFYLASTLLYWTHLWTQSPRPSKLGYYLIVIGALAQTIILVKVFMMDKPVFTGIERSLFLFAWFIAIAFIASDLKLKVSVLGTFVAPLIFLLTVPIIIIPHGIIEANPSIRNPWILLHVMIVFLGEAIFTVAFVAGFLYIFQERRLKSKRIGSFLMKLPSLTRLDRLNHLCLLIGFPILTVGLALGVLSAKQIWGVFWKWDYKEVWALGTWFLFGVLMHGRLMFSWKGRRAAVGAILGFAVIIATMFVISYLTPGKYEVVVPN